MKETGENKPYFIEKFYVTKKSSGEGKYEKYFCNIVDFRFLAAKYFQFDYNKIDIDDIDFNEGSEDSTRLEILLITYCNNNYIEPSLLKAEHGWAAPILVTTPSNSHGFGITGKYVNLDKLIEFSEKVLSKISVKKEREGIEMTYPSYIAKGENIKLVINSSQQESIIANLGFLCATIKRVKEEIGTHDDKIFDMNIMNAWIANPLICIDKLKDCSNLHVRHLFTAFGISETFFSKNIVVKANHVSTKLEGYTGFRANLLPVGYISKSYCSDGVLSLNIDGSLNVTYNIDVYANAFDGIDVDENRKNVLDPNTIDREEYFGWSQVRFTFQPIDNLMRDKRTIQILSNFIKAVQSFKDYLNPDERIRSGIVSPNHYFAFNLESIEIIQSKNRTKLKAPIDYLKDCLANLELDDYVILDEATSDTYAKANFRFEKGVGEGDYALTIDECDPYTKYLYVN